LLREQIEYESIPEPNSGCWLWTGPVINRGYGRINRKLAHRAAYEAFRGPIPKGQCVCHKCDNPICVNPDHLFIGTQKDNMMDKARKGRGNNTKITADTAREVRNNTGTYREISKKFGVSIGMVHYIKRMKYWTHA